MIDGPAHYVDSAKGNDATDGTRDKPFQTFGHAISKVKPGQTIYLRGGTYYEHVSITVAGTTDKPITIRSFPGELAIIDGGIREFFETPEKAWEPCPDGVKGEYQSVKSYPNPEARADGSNVLGNFGDSLVPLHAYRFIGDLRTDNVYFNLKTNTGGESSIYCGPGLFYDRGSGRIHVRLAHTGMKYLSDKDNYRGETDPRKMPLVVAGQRENSPLSLRGAKHIRVQDLVVRGASGPTVELLQCEDIEFDGVTAYGGSTCFVARDSTGLRLAHSACRGLAAPWTFRGSLKYRAIESRLFSASGWTPTGVDNRDFELAYSEFTDSVDGVFIGSVRGLRMHHCLIENVSDDAVFLTAGTGFDGITPGGDMQIYQNRFARCLTCFAFGVGHGRQKVLASGFQTGSGSHIFRNVFDLRKPVMYQQPRSPEDKAEITSNGRFAGDHGGPAWEPMTIYHNTIIADDAPRYTYATWGLGNAMGRGTKRRVFNNIVVQLNALPGATFPPVISDFQADGNLNWSVALGPMQTADPFTKFRQSKAFTDSKQQYPPGWGANDRFADPKFAKFDPVVKINDLRLQMGSPAIDAGVAIPNEWPDPLREKGKPDIGALPFESEPWAIGVNGRLNVFGGGEKKTTIARLPPLQYTPRPALIDERHKPAAIVEGYPAFDVPLLHFAFRKQQVNVDVFEKDWLDSSKYGQYGTIILSGNLARAKVEHATFNAQDIKNLETFLNDGGTFILTVSGREAFRSPDGQKFLTQTLGNGPPSKNKEAKPAVLMPNHPWLKHLNAKEPPAWIGNLTKPGALNPKQGDRIIGTADGNSLLYRQQVGKGQFIFIGWEVHDSLPYTRDKPSSVEMETTFEQQMQILLNIAADLYSKK